MDWVSLHCRRCGDVLVDGHTVTIVNRTLLLAVFRCPRCRRLTTQQIEIALALELAGAGARIVGEPDCGHASGVPLAAISAADHFASSRKLPPTPGARHARH